MQSPVLSREEELYWLALRLVPGLGARTSGKLLDRFRTPQAIFRASRTELEAAGVSGSAAQSIASGTSFEDAAAQQEKMAETGTVAVTLSDPRYPQRLRGVDAGDLAGRGGHAASHAIRPGGGGAAFERPGPRRAHHRQRHGARHRYGGTQRRAGHGRRYRGGAGLRRGRRLTVR